MTNRVDRMVIDKGAVEGAARVAYRAGGWLRQYAVGSVNTSTAVITVGTMLVLAFLFASMVILG